MYTYEAIFEDKNGEFKFALKDVTTNDEAEERAKKLAAAFDWNYVGVTKG